MAERQCEQCGETVDAARAFCPACGNPFVTEEKREQQSNYEKMDKTMQMGNTLYGKMLSDMGLNIQKPQAEKRVEVLTPAVGAPKQESPKPAPPREVPLQPAALEPTNPTAAQAVVPPPVSQKKSYIVWGLIGGGVLLLGLVAVAIIAVAFYWYSLRGR